MVTEGLELAPAVKRGLTPVGLRFAHLLPFKATGCSVRMEGGMGWPLGTFGWSGGGGRTCFDKVAPRSHRGLEMGLRGPPPGRGPAHTC